MEPHIVTRTEASPEILHRTHRPLRAPAPPRSRMGVPWGLLGMIGLIACIEPAIAGRPLAFSEPVTINWCLSTRDAREKAPGCEILALGDSLVKHGIIPQVVEAGTGKRVWNLSAARGPAPATYFLLRRALDAGARPEAVIVNFKPSVLIGSPRYNLPYWQGMASLRETWELAQTSRSFSLFVEILLGRCVPTFRCRHEVRDAIVAALHGKASPRALENRACQRNWTVNHGANVANKNPAFTGAFDAVRHKILTNPYAHKTNKFFINKFFELATVRGIRVYWLLPPFSPALQAAREQSGAEAAYLALVRSMLKRYPGIVVVDGHSAHYPYSVFVDSTHLDGEGGQVLSSALAELLRNDRPAAAPASRWRSLPEFRKPEARLPIEDIGQSTAIAGASL